MPDELDVGDIAAVPEDQQLDVDAHDESDTALADGADDDLGDVYANPGEVVEL